MEEPTREKFYEKYAWVILFVIGILIFFFLTWRNP